MSAAGGLVRFKRTGHIYACCYEGTSDIVIPYILPFEEVVEDDGTYNPIGKIRAIPGDWHYDPTPDTDEIEIWVSYGGHFWWEGTGSESKRMIEGPLDPWDKLTLKDIHHEDPQWVIDFLYEGEDRQ